MSEQDTDALIGRLIRERSDAQRDKAAIDTQVRVIAETMREVQNRLEHMTPEMARQELRGIEKFFSIEGFIDLLTQRETAKKTIATRDAELFNLGVDPPPLPVIRPL